MKIAVMTLSLSNNYGGNLQAYALMNTLKDLGHNPIFINLRQERSFISFTKFYIKKYLLFFKYRNPVLYAKKKNMVFFISEHINPKTTEIYSSKALHHLFKLTKFDACIIGSDQVFRPSYFGKYKDDYSLGFINDNTIKLSYAASFGGDKYHGNLSKLKFHKENIQKFKAISVREDSGVSLCKDLFGVEATHVLDPTMIIDKNKYLELFLNLPGNSTKGKIFTYILDENNDTDLKIENFAKLLNLKVYKIQDGGVSKNTPSVQEWLKSIYDAEYVITDSFHGCVFSIIFNKPFYCFINKDRGADRFISLLKIFSLENRIVYDQFEKSEIDWDLVNQRIDNNRNISKKFLIDNLIKNK